MKSWMQGLRAPTNPPMAYPLPGGRLWASSFWKGFRGSSFWLPV